MGINAQGIYEWDGDETFPEWRNDLTASITSTVADINADIAAIAVPADSGWVTVTTFGTGWIALSGYTPRFRKVGDRVDIEGALSRVGTTGLLTNLLTVPVGYRPLTNTFIGASISAQGRALQLRAITTGVLDVPSGYTIGSIATGEIIPLAGSWYVN